MTLADLTMELVENILRQKMAAVHIFGRTLPILYLWQDFAQFVNLAAVHEFGRSNAKINTGVEGTVTCYSYTVTGYCYTVTCNSYT
jgi:hypothetical protein